MRKDILFAGLMMNWSDQFAGDYCSKLTEMGFYAKVLEDNIVAYSPLPFSRSEAVIAFDGIEKEGETPPTAE